MMHDGTVVNVEAGGLGDGGAAWVEDAERGTVLSFNGDNASGAYGGGGEIVDYNDLPPDGWGFHVVVKSGDTLTCYRNKVEGGTNLISAALFNSMLFFSSAARAPRPRVVWSATRRSAARPRCFLSRTLRPDMLSSSGTRRIPKILPSVAPMTR
jgi:hypothetical protein